MGKDTPDYFLSSRSSIAFLQRSKEERLLEDHLGA